MARKVNKSFLRSPYFFIGIILFIGLSIFSLRKERELEKEANRQIHQMAFNYSTQTIETFKSIIFEYGETLEVCRKALQKGENVNVLKQYLIIKDSVYNDLQLLKGNPTNEDFLLVPNYTEKTENIQFILPLNNNTNQYLSLKIPLIYLHDKIAQSSNNTYAYFTFQAKDKYVYHPDEKKLGEVVEEAYKAKGKNNKKVSEVISNYLDIPVYRTFQVLNYGGQNWEMTANIPGISFNEMINGIRNSFIYTLVFASIAFILIFLTGVWYWRKEFMKTQDLETEKMMLEIRNEQQKKDVLEKELEHLKNGLNPHFLFNSLSSLKILVNKDTRLANDFAGALSNLYRYLLKQENKDVVPFTEELDFSKDYIFLQQIRFKDLIEVETNIPEEYLTRQIPPVSLQLLIENCIKHTKMTVRNPLKINISADNDYLVVTNNFNPPEKSHSYGKGLSNLTKRYAMLTDLPCDFGENDGLFVARIPFV